VRWVLETIKIAPRRGNWSGGEVRLASEAALPTEPVGPRKGLSTVLGGLFGLVLGVVAAFVVNAWQAVVGKSAALAAHTQVK